MASQSRPAEDTASSLGEAVSRAELVLDRLNSAVSDAEERLDSARRDAERTIAAADELRQDVGSLIVALQGLAAEVDAQVREHTVALMRTMSGTMPVDVAASQRATASVADEVAALIEELRATADDISSDLEAKSGELRELIDQASRVRPAPPTRRVPAEAVSAPNTFGARALAADDEQPLTSVRERAQTVQDQIELSRRPKAQDYGRYAEAVDLAAKGVSADEIARRCGLGREEVRMLLRLRPSEPARR
ncbi:MAG: DUF2802 domain-containing protein [Anaerolineae bacterium]